MRRSASIAAAWMIGWLVYMIAMALTVYDGVLSLLFQPFVAAIVSAFGVAAAVLAGLILRLPPLGRLWHSRRAWAGAMAGMSLLVLGFGSALGMTSVFMDPETGRRFVGLHPGAALGGYFLMLFAVANWPVSSAGSAKCTDDRHVGLSRREPRTA